MTCLDVDKSNKWTTLGELNNDLLHLSQGRHQYKGVDRITGRRMLTNSRDIIRRLESEGWRLVRSKGSHRQFKHPTKPGRVTVPHPKKDMPLKTTLNIYQSAGWTKD